MKRAIQAHLNDFIAIIVMIVLAALVAVYVLGHERLHMPGWVPFIGQDFYVLKGDFSTGQALTPGQGQTVDIAGVPVGEISSVQLKDGRALVSMNIRRKYDKIYPNATMLMRPKTGLKDMVIELDPGDPSAGAALHSGSVIPVSQTQPDVNLDELLSSLDADSRAYLQLLVHGAGEALNGNGDQLRATLKRFDPLARDTKKVTELVAQRRVNMANAVHSFRQLTGALAGKDKALAKLVDSSNAVFASLARQQANLRATIAQLPPALQVTDTALQKTDRLARVLGPALGNLRPGARALASAQVEQRPFLRESVPIIRDELRPFTRQALPTITLTTPTARSLNASTGNLVSIFKVLNYAFNELAYDPPGKENGYLFFLPWANHDANSLFSLQDANGVVRHTLFLGSCYGTNSLVTVRAPGISPRVAPLNPAYPVGPGKCVRLSSNVGSSATASAHRAQPSGAKGPSRSTTSPTGGAKP